MTILSGRPGDGCRQPVWAHDSGSAPTYLPEDEQPPDDFGYELVGWFVAGITVPVPDAHPVYAVRNAVPPVHYTTARGRPGRRRRDAAEGWRSPMTVYLPDFPDSRFHEDYWLEENEDARWRNLRWFPNPQTRRGMFWARILEGLLMCYPFPSVVAFAWRHRHTGHRMRDLRPRARAGRRSGGLE